PSARSLASTSASDSETAKEMPELDVGGVFDEGVAAPNGDEFTVVARPRRLPVIGSSLVTSAIFGDQYEVWVRAWPHRFRDEVEWSTTVPSGDAFVVAHELVELLKQGQWRPNDGEPPLSETLR